MEQSAAKGRFEPKETVRRILAVAGVNPPDKEAYWLGWHMEKFVGYARRHCELLDLPVAIESYLASRRAETPPPAAWHLAQCEQALAFFARGTDGTAEGRNE